MAILNDYLELFKGLFGLFLDGFMTFFYPSVAGFVG